MHIRVRESARRVKGKPVKRYQAVWYEHGREYRETFDTRDLAEDKLDHVKTQLAQGNHRPVCASADVRPSMLLHRNGSPAVTISSRAPVPNTQTCSPTRPEPAVI